MVHRPTVSGTKYIDRCVQPKLEHGGGCCIPVESSNDKPTMSSAASIEAAWKLKASAFGWG